MAPVIGWILVYGAIDRTRNYTEVDALVLGTADLCTPKPTLRDNRDVLDADPKWGVQRWGNCDDATVFVSSHPGFELVRTERMLIRYISPADGAEHSSNIQIPTTPAQPGTTVKVYVHNRIADKVKSL
jgi:hypothetical protein